jgi:hypothetical protein
MRLVILAASLAAFAALAGCGKVSDTPSDCTAPCAGDPVDDFAETQGGSNGRWKYLADTRSINGATYEEMTWGTIRGEPGWVSSGGTSPAGILSCADNPDAQGCADLDTSLMFYPGTDQDPALAFVAPDNGTYALSGKVRSATGNPEGLAQRFMISRSARHDLIDSRVHVTSPTADEFTAQVELLAGDRLILTFVGGTTESVPVAFDYHLTLVANGADAFPGKCKMSLRFDGADAFADPCRSTVENLNDAGAGPVSTATPSVNADFGDARDINTGEFLRSPGGPLDYSGDFTVQFWAKLATAQGFAATLFADWNVDAKGGFNLGPDDATAEIYLCSFWHTGTDASCGTGMRPLDNEWHFFRVTRSVQEAAIELCIDGRQVVSDPNVGASDMTSDQLPHIGRNVDYNPATLVGAIDEVRVFKTALPCPTP